MISAVNTNLNQLTSELVAAKQNTKITTNTEGKETVDTSLFDSAPAPRTDTLEISPEGYAAAYAQTSTETSSDASAQYSTLENGTSSDTTVMDNPPPPPPTSKLEATDSTSSTDSSQKNLSSYSEDELDQMVEDGSITEAEKNLELARRAMEEEMETQRSDSETAESTDSSRPPKPEDGTTPPPPPFERDVKLKDSASTDATTDTTAAAAAVSTAEEE